MSVNVVVLMGRITSTPELRKTSENVSVTTIRLAVDRNYVKNGKERETDFIDVVAWRNTADFICKNFKKGSLIAIKGSIQTRTYKTKDDTTRTVTEVVADDASFTGERLKSDSDTSDSEFRPMPEDAADLPF